MELKPGSDASSRHSSAEPPPTASSFNLRSPCPKGVGFRALRLRIGMKKLRGSLVCRKQKYKMPAAGRMAKGLSGFVHLAYTQAQQTAGVGCPKP